MSLDGIIGQPVGMLRLWATSRALPLVLVGPHGCGKTAAIEAMGAEFQLELETVPFLSPMPSGEAIPVFERAGLRDDQGQGVVELLVAKRTFICVETVDSFEQLPYVLKYMTYVVPFKALSVDASLTIMSPKVSGIDSALLAYLAQESCGDLNRMKSLLLTAREAQTTSVKEFQNLQPRVDQVQLLELAASRDWVGGMQCVDKSIQSGRGITGIADDLVEALRRVITARMQRHEMPTPLYHLPERRIFDAMTVLWEMRKHLSGDEKMVLTAVFAMLMETLSPGAESQSYAVQEWTPGATHGTDV